MKKSLIVGLLVATNIFSGWLAYAQAFGEYGRMLGGMPQGQGVTGPRAPGGVTPGGSGNRILRPCGLVPYQHRHQALRLRISPSAQPI